MLGQLQDVGKGRGHRITWIWSLCSWADIVTYHWPREFQKTAKLRMMRRSHDSSLGRGVIEMF